jgi:subtilisin family serine protease
MTTKRTRNDSQKKGVAEKDTSPVKKAAAKVASQSQGQSAEGLVVSSGAQPQAQTIIYVHGIGNKPPANILKCQWDNALFGVELGDRSRLAYWVNRSFYPTPTDDGCTSSDIVRIDDDEMSTKAVLTLAKQKPVSGKEAVDAEIKALTEDDGERQILGNIAKAMENSPAAGEAAFGALDVQAKLLPLPPVIRRLITQITTRAFLRDVHEFFFDQARREAMEKSLLERIRSGGGPFVIIGHSQGSMIAYNLLRGLTKADCDVRLLVTIGSPLGMSEVKDILGQWNNGEFRVPECVTRWINVADPLDPVAVDRQIADEYPAGEGQSIQDYDVRNPDSPRHPHSGTGYLRTAPVQQELRHAVGNGFAQPVAKAVIAKDLVRDIENGYMNERHPTLIQLSVSGLGESISAVGKNLVSKLSEMVMDATPDHNGHALELQRANIELLKRYVSANLTRSEIEMLRNLSGDLRIERVWRNSEKRALVNDSADTLQCSTAVAGYGATGREIGWAVLDTGIRGDHPHFAKHGNIVFQWDCTQNGAPVQHKPGSKQSDTLDRQGHGTHVAGIIAGELTVLRKKDDKQIRMAGMAPETMIYGFKVLDDRGYGRDAWIIKALDAVADINEQAGELRIAGINLSLGGNFDPSVYGCGHSPLCQELRRLWGQGVLVCLAAGNEGYALLQSANGDVPSNMDLSIGDPANLEEAIAVGSVHKLNPHTYGVSYFSSRGPTADGRVKPDLVAPGERILSALHDIDGKAGSTALEDLYVEMSGTSMAAPHVSGLLAGYLSKRKEFVGRPAEVKQHLLMHCTTLNRDRYVQGAGMPNSVRMLLAK